MRMFKNIYLVELADLNERIPLNPVCTVLALNRTWWL
jgi:hypothetical protein